MEFVEVPKTDSDSNNNDNNFFITKLKEIEEDENKISQKIIIQKEEIEKTKILLRQIEDCCEAQEQMLNQFFARQLEIKNKKLELLNNYENYRKNFIDLTNVEENNSNHISDECEKLNQHYDLKRKHSENEEIKIEEKRLNEENFERERIERKNSDQIVNKSFFKPKFILKLPENVTINKLSINKSIIYVCGSDGFIAECYTRTALIKELHINTNDNIVDMVRIKDKIFAFSLNTMFAVNSTISATIIKIFYANITSSVHLRGYMIFIPLQDGTVWKFDYNNNSINKFYRSSIAFTNFLFIKKGLSILLINQSVIAMYQDYQKTLVENGCRNIDIYDDTRLICTFEKKIQIINLQNEKTIFEKRFTDCVVLVRSSKLVVVVLDSKNKLHIFRIERKYKFEDLPVIQLPIEHEISAIMPTWLNENSNPIYVNYYRKFRISI